MKRQMTVLLAVGLLCVTAGQARANIIVNGGFETGDFTGWTTIPAPSGSLYGVDGNPHTGNNAAYFGAVVEDSFDQIQQTIATTPGATYIVDYWLSNDNNSTPCDFIASWNGTVLSSNEDAPGFPYTHFSFLVTGTGSDTLNFSSYNVPAFFFLDDVAVNLVASAVPEPASLTLAGLGILGLVGYGWRRRQPVI